MCYRGPALGFAGGAELWPGALQLAPLSITLILSQAYQEADDSGCGWLAIAVGHDAESRAALPFWLLLRPELLRQVLDERVAAAAILLIPNASGTHPTVSVMGWGPDTLRRMKMAPDQHISSQCLSKKIFFFTNKIIEAGVS